MSIFPIYTVSWLRNAVPEPSGFFGTSVITLCIFMKVSAPGFTLRHKNPGGTFAFGFDECKSLKLMWAHATVPQNNDNTKLWVRAHPKGIWGGPKGTLSAAWHLKGECLHFYQLASPVHQMPNFQQTPSWTEVLKQCIKGVCALEMRKSGIYTTIFSCHCSLFMSFFFFSAAPLCSLWCWITCSCSTWNFKQPGFAINKSKAN